MRNMATRPLSDLPTERAVTREKLGAIHTSAALVDHEERALYHLGDLQHLLAKDLPPSADPLEAEGSVAVIVRSRHGVTVRVRHGVKDRRITSFAGAVASRHAHSIPQR
jgi:hypothetical protein